MTEKTARLILILLVIAGNVLADQVTKVAARSELKGRGTVRVVGDVFVMRYAENSGAFLGLGANLPNPWRKFVFSLFPVVLMAGLSFYIFRNKQLTRWELVWYACIIGGGIGNIIDRLAFDGMVTDFLNFGIGSLRTGILNVADISITAGVVGLVILLGLQSRAEKKKKAAAPGGDTAPD